MKRLALLIVAASAIGTGCKKDAPSAPAAAAVKPDLVAKYDRLATETCACKDPACWATLRAKAQAELDIDRANLPVGADGDKIKAALARHHSCGAAIESGAAVAPSGIAPAAVEAAKALAANPPPAATAPSTAPAAPPVEAPKAEAPAAEAPAAEAPAVEAAPTEAPEGAAEAPEGAAEAPEGAAEAPEGAAEAPEGATEAIAPEAEKAFWELYAELPGASTVKAIEAAAGGESHVLFGVALDKVVAAFPTCVKDEGSDLRPYFTSCTVSADDNDDGVKVVVGAVDGVVFQVAIQLGKDSGKVRPDVEEALDADPDDTFDDGYRRKAYVYELSKTAVTVREKGRYRTLMVADKAKNTAFRERDANGIEADLLNGQGASLARRSPRHNNLAAADKRLSDAIDLVPAFGEARVNRCNLRWLGFGNTEEAEADCKAALNSKSSAVRIDANVQLAMIANVEDDKDTAREYLAAALEIETYDDGAIARAKRLDAVMNGRASKSQLLGALDDAACALFEGDQDRMKRSAHALGVSDSGIDTQATRLGISAEDLMARTAGRCAPADDPYYEPSDAAPSQQQDMQQQQQ